MNTSAPQLIGLATIGLLMLIVCWLFLRRHRAVMYFALACCAVGLGYLATTPTPTTIAKTIFGQPY
jgi:hypothetical protein